MKAEIIARRSRSGLLARLDLYLRNGWKIQGGLCYGDERWAVLLVKEEKGKANESDLC